MLVEWMLHTQLCRSGYNQGPGFTDLMGATYGQRHYIHNCM